MSWDDKDCQCAFVTIRKAWKRFRKKLFSGAVTGEKTMSESAKSKDNNETRNGVENYIKIAVSSALFVLGVWAFFFAENPNQALNCIVAIVSLFSASAVLSLKINLSNTRVANNSQTSEGNHLRKILHNDGQASSNENAGTNTGVMATLYIDNHTEYNSLPRGDEQVEPMSPESFSNAESFENKKINIE